MLFNSYEFIFLFVPIVLAVFFFIGNIGRHRAAIAWLVGASLFFYGWWNPAYLSLILVSILFNYAIGSVLGGRPSRPLLILGIIGNLGALGYFKYANFFFDNFNAATGSAFEIGTVALPLAISFFTFQQITYIVDAYLGKTREYNFLHYCLFVTFFPQLIAGPIVHHKEMLPQFTRDSVYKINYVNLAIGLTIFSIGLFKKVVLADSISLYANPVFTAAEGGVGLTLVEAWGGALAYTFQLYFDFSGYSDMAIGIARLFGIRLPLNFNSPYKAVNIMQFWRCWHMTLSRFLKEFVYIPLGGSRRGMPRRYINLMVTMVLGGLWHGAGWTFVVWGALHGLYLLVNHGWHVLRRFVGMDISKSTFVGRWMGRLVTFLAVVVSWVFFRAESFSGATNVLAGMSGQNGISLPHFVQVAAGSWADVLAENGVVFQGFDPNNIVQGWSGGIVLLACLFLIAWFLPNTQQFMQNYRPAFETYPGEIQRLSWRILKWRPTLIWSIATCAIAIYSIMSMSEVNEFLYFNF